MGITTAMGGGVVRRQVGGGSGVMTVGLATVLTGLFWLGRMVAGLYLFSGAVATAAVAGAVAMATSATCGCGW